MKQIYVHGLGQTSDSWTKTIDILQTTDYSLCPNLPDLVHSKEVTYDNLYAAFSDYCNQYDEPIVENEISIDSPIRKLRE